MIDAVAALLQQDWPRIRQQLLERICRPKPVRRVDVPKRDGSQRVPVIPTVTYRLIQQVLQPRIDLIVIEHSYGYRPGRRAQDAVLFAPQPHVVEVERRSYSATSTATS